MVDQKIFRDAMSRLGAAVNIVTTDGAAGRHGLTVSAVCSITDAPPTLMVCVNRNSASHAKLTQNGVLCVNVLAGRHQALAGRFAGPPPEGEDRFDTVTWNKLETGCPVLNDATVSFDCKITLSRFIGTHSAFLCEVQAIALHENAEGLIYFDRAYHHVMAAQKVS